MLNKEEFLGSQCSSMEFMHQGQPLDGKRIIGTSNAIAAVRKQVLEFAREIEPVLLKGETGVGKTFIAELLHRYSDRQGEFVVVDITTIAENLFESEMFGYKKGAFTDARADKKGLVAHARGGTLFIDEISEIPLHLQAKLMRFIDTKSYRVLGQCREEFSDVRIIAATNRDLHRAIAKGVFRQDLYYRLQVLEVKIPPLRCRREDIRALVSANRHLLKGKTIGKNFWDVLFNQQWYGNIRELLNVLKRAGISAANPIRGKDLLQLISGNHYRNSDNEETGISSVDHIWNRIICDGLNFWDAVKKPFLKRDLNRSEVKEIISRGLRRGSGTFKDLIKIFNLYDKDYHRFMTFLRDNRLR